MQYILDLKRPELARRVVIALLGSLCELSQRKFSSDVIEKTLMTGDREVTSMVVQELLEPDTLGTMLHEPFTNYVIQEVLQVGTDSEMADIFTKPMPKDDKLYSMFRNIIMNV